MRPPLRLVHPAPSGTRRSNLLWIVAICAWVIAVGAGLVILWEYRATPGQAARPQDRWPVESSIPAPSGKPTLVLLAHPHCPCTRATLTELGVLMGRVRERVNVYVLFVKPDDTPDDFTATDLFATASTIPGVNVRVDRGGREAALFHALTSGQTVLYDAGGQLLFAGGITGSRGHVGENSGVDRIVSLVTDGTSDKPTSLVYGCPLEGPG